MRMYSLCGYFIHLNFQVFLDSQLQRSLSCLWIKLVTLTWFNPESIWMNYSYIKDTIHSLCKQQTKLLLKHDVLNRKFRSCNGIQHTKQITKTEIYKIKMNISFPKCTIKLMFQITFRVWKTQVMCQNCILGNIVRLSAKRAALSDVNFLKSALWIQAQKVLGKNDNWNVHLNVNLSGKLSTRKQRLKSGGIVSSYWSWMSHGGPQDFDAWVLISTWTCDGEIKSRQIRMLKLS